MNKELLRKYLDDFYSGITTPEQENTLREYFQTEHHIIDEDFRTDAAMFQAMTEATIVPSDLESRIVNATVKRKIKIPKLYKWCSVAAAIAIIVTLIGITPTTSPYHEVSDPDEATEIAMQVSQKLRKNVSKLELLNHINL